MTIYIGQGVPAVPESAVGAANGVAPLDGTSKVPLANLPTGVGSTGPTGPTGPSGPVGATGPNGGSRTVQTIGTYASTMTPTLPSSGDLIVVFPTLTGSPTIAAPTGTPVDGQIMDHRFIENSSGNNVPTYSASIYDFNGYVTSSMISTVAATASISFTVRFIYYAAISKFVASAINAGY